MLICCVSAWFFVLFWIAVLRYDFRTDEGRRLLWRRLIPESACLKAAAAMICLSIPTQRSTPYFLFPALAPRFSAAVLFGSPGCERRQALPPGTAVQKHHAYRTGPVSVGKYRNFSLQKRGHKDYLHISLITARLTVPICCPAITRFSCATRLLPFLWSKYFYRV